MTTESERLRSATGTAALSGGLSGGVLGMATGLPTARTKRELMLRALIGSLTGAGLTGGSTYIGSKLMGVPDDDDSGGYMRRGALGGAVGGGALGALTGASIGSGHIPVPPAAAQKGSMLAKAIGQLARGRGGALKGAALGALGLGAVAGYQSADEGMQLDVIQEEMKKAKRRQLEEGM